MGVGAGAGVGVGADLGAAERLEAFVERDQIGIELFDEGLAKLFEQEIIHKHRSVSLPARDCRQLEVLRSNELSELRDEFAECIHLLRIGPLRSARKNRACAPGAEQHCRERRPPHDVAYASWLSVATGFRLLVGLRHGNLIFPYPGDALLQLIDLGDELSGPAEALRVRLDLVGDELGK